jgi:transposase-like protein
MVKTRREFTPEFKREAVALLESSDRPTMQIATELGISPSMLRNWRVDLHRKSGELCMKQEDLHAEEPFYERVSG